MPMNTTCEIKTTGSGCCPIGALCSSPAICYDHASSNCTNTSDPKQQCCPSNLPFCRDFPPIGLGCYASSTMSSASTTVPSTTATATSGVFPEPTMTSSAFGSTVTVTVSVVSNGGSLILEFPTSSVGGALEATKYVLDCGSSSVIPLPVDTSTVLPGLTATVTSTIVTVSSTPSSTSSAPPPSPPPSSTAPSTLCFNTALQTPAPCPSTTSTSSSGNPLVTTLPTAGATAKSQASRSLNPITSTETFQLVMGLLAVCLTGLILGVLLFQIYDRIRGCMRRRREAPTPRETVMHTRADDISEINEMRMGERDIRVVRESGKRLSCANRLDREITVVTGSARPFKEPVVVDKTAIRVVEGSARLLDNGVLLGQEKLVEKGKEEKASLGHVFFGARENA
ncbi:hypothetical protein OEA41_004101 [Lepraria neglecta]|uniref:Uncharacterized protein n=1 Tax=Lepraria neglecta TaxID=209136 RepID=A0AAE0DJ15_9LECA|nr:hypothetical protein OEA41_004101 [Lepraria neglecta]